MTTTFTAGVDWGTRRHHVCLMDHRGKVLKEQAFEHGGGGLAAMSDWLLDRDERPADRVQVAIEVPHGPVVETLMESGFRVHSINPMQLDRFRDRFSASGAKDDRRDAKALASALRTDPDCLRPVEEPDDDTIEMRGAARARKELVADRNGIANRIRQHLVDYYPQFLDATDGEVTAAWAIDLWKRLPTPEKARRVRKTTLVRMLGKHRIRRIDGDELAERLKALPIKRRNASVESARNRILSLLPILEQYNQQIDKARTHLQRTLQHAKESRLDDAGLPDAAILNSIPGIGDHVLATLLTEAEQVLNQRDHAALRCLAGVAPVTVRSGARKTVRRRRARNHRLADAVYHWARVAVQRDPESRDTYNRARKRGKTHGHALRIVGDRLLRIACAMLRDRTLFQPRHGQEQHAERADPTAHAQTPDTEPQTPPEGERRTPGCTETRTTTNGTSRGRSKPEPEPSIYPYGTPPGRPEQRPTRTPEQHMNAANGLTHHFN